MIELVLIKEHKKQRNNTYQKGILTHNRGTCEREPGNKKPRTPTRNCWGGKISILICDVAVKSVDGSQSSRELEDLQETRE
jgi:hypothetical protein